MHQNCDPLEKLLQWGADTLRALAITEVYVGVRDSRGKNFAGSRLIEFRGFIRTKVT